jgi:hypothetical protein
MRSLVWDRLKQMFSRKLETYMSSKKTDSSWEIPVY